ncbi:MAG: J domain-containing protein [Candidatus Levybacteria bacterium]|nr:J domain-containing protein [Candidatus Levybacteria bacterium]
MADTKDYYQTLGVTKTASPDEIKKAYRKLALQYHPDRNRGKDSVTKFKEVTKAYEVLSDPQKKQTYDQFGHAAFEQGAGQGPSGGAGGPFGGFGQQQGGPFSYSYSTGGDGGAGFDFGGFNDPFEIFEQFFGGASPFGRQQRRQTYSLTIDFLEAVRGVTKKVTIDGETQAIKIPAGVDEGSRIRFGDYDIVVSVTSDKRFQREGFDVIGNKDISFTQAALGGEVNIETIDGDLKLKIPGGTQPNTAIRLQGKGVPHLHGSGHGDHYVRIKITVPKHLTSKQKELLKEFEGEKGKSSWF